MKIFSISDLHLSINSNKPMDIFGPVWDNYFDDIKLDWLEKVSEEDVVLLCGDLSWAMKLDKAVEDINLLNTLPGKKIIIKGNHDYWWQSLTALRKVLPENFYCLQNDAIKIGEYIFCGTRLWNFPTGKFNTPENVKIFEREKIRLDLTLNSAKKLQTNNEKIICMLHYPPVESSLSDNEITTILEKYNVDSVIFGHIHNKSYLPLTFKKDNINYFLTSCDIVENKLILIK